MDTEKSTDKAFHAVNQNRKLLCWLSVKSHWGVRKTLLRHKMGASYAGGNHPGPGW